MKTAIVVDDELITRLDFSQMLSAMDFEVIDVVADGFDAVELCKKRRPDIVLMDLRMPIFDGFSATEKLIREDLAGSVIVISAYSDEPTVMRAVKAGISAYLIKPVDQSTLFSTVQTALALREREDKLRERIHKAEEALESMKLVERAKAQLAGSCSISEAEAYRKMQKLAMDKRCSMRAIAEHLLESNDSAELSRRAKQLLMQEEGLSEKEAYKRLCAIAAQSHCSTAEAARTLLAQRGGI